MVAEKLAKLLNGHKSQNGEWIACCPNHKEKRPSFSVKGEGKNIVMKCFAGCDQKALFKSAIKIYEDAYGKEINEVEQPRERTITEYEYANEEGKVCFKVVRTDDGVSKSFKQLHLENDEWKYGRGDVLFTPYCYEKWKDQGVIIFVEGEKCVHAVESLGLLATCVPGGVNGWKEEYFKKYFEGKDVVIIPDNDKPGQEFAQTIFSSLQDTANPMIVNLPGLEGKEDIVEWIEKGGTLEKLKAIAKKVKDSPLESMGFIDELSNADFVDTIQDENSKKIIPFGIQFLDDAWGGILPTDVCAISAKSGVGKTQMAMMIALNAMNTGKKVAFFALEAFRNEIAMRMIYTMAVDKYIRKKGHHDPYASWSDWVRGEQKLRLAMKPFVDEARAELKERYAGKLFTHYLKQKFTIEDFETRFPMISKNCDLIILDHLHYISKSPNQTANDFLSDSMFRIKDLVLAYKKPVLMVVHVRKEDTNDRKPIPDAEDIHGSSDIFKIATKVCIIGKPLDGGYDVEKHTQDTYIKIPKDRLGEIPDWMIAKMEFSKKRQAYEPGYDIVKVVKKKDKQWEEIPLSKKPDWYNRSLKKQETFYYDV